MEKLAHRSFKFALFLSIFVLSIRYVHTYPIPMPADQFRILLAICDRLNVRDPDDVYIPAMLFLELLTTIAAYVAVMRLLCHFKTRTRADAPRTVGRKPQR